MRQNNFNLYLTNVFLSDFTIVPFGFVEKLVFWHYYSISTSFYDDNSQTESIWKNLLDKW